MADRITYHGDELDEVVLRHAAVHIEQMSTHHWAVIIDGPNGEYVHLTASDVTVFEMADAEGITETYGARGYGCAATSGRHRCDRDGRHWAHRCDCGAWFWTWGGR